MNDIIKIDFNETHEPVVSARELHEKLGIEKRFSAWWGQQAARLSLIEEQDYRTSRYTNSNNQTFADYLIPLNTAKHLCMISGGDTSHKIRQYFIQVEQAWNSPEQVMARALLMSKQKIDSLQSKVIELLPKAEMHDLFLTGNNAQPMNVVAKSLGIGRNRLFKLLRYNNILMCNNTPYQRYIDRGYFKVIEKPIVMGDQTINKPQTLVTAKGVNYIGQIVRQISA